MFRTRRFIFRETVVYTVMVRFRLTCIGINSLVGRRVCGVLKYRVIHKSVRQFKNSQQIDYATDHGNSYADRERNCLSFF